MKRLAAALDKTSPGTDVAPPRKKKKTPTPFTHYALIYLDNKGKLNVDESASIQEQNSTIFTPEVRQSFLEILGKRAGPHQSICRKFDASPRRVRRGGSHGSGSDDSVPDADSDGDDCSLNDSNELVPLCIGDTPKVLAYYEGALEHFQQFNCSKLVKASIKLIEPRKQAHHPYNGGKQGSLPGTTGDPEKTKPDWWPPGVKHKQPDHMRKEYRIPLLLHIIRNLGNYGISADKLMEVAGDTKRSLKHPSHVDIIYEILRVRKMEEQFERGEVDAKAVVYVINRGPSPKGKDEEDSNKSTVPVPAVEAPKPMDMDEGLLTPVSMEQPAPLMTPIYPMSTTAAQTLQTSFSVPRDLDLRSGSDSPGQRFYHTTSHYTQSSLQPMPSTFIPPELIRPHNVSFDDHDPTSSPFSTSLPDQKYDDFARTSRQAPFEDYNTLPAPGRPPQPMMQDHMPTLFPAQSHCIPHDRVQSPLEMSQCALSVCTGPLGYSSYALPPSNSALVPVPMDGQARSEAIPSNYTAEWSSRVSWLNSSFYHAIR